MEWGGGMVAWVTVGLGLVHLLGAWLFVTWVLRPPEYAHKNRNQPAVSGKAAILVALRGRDPSLGALIDALGKQTYSDYQVHFVVDGFSARQREWLAETIAQQTNAASFHIHELKDPPPTCGLKCAALSQGLAALKSDCAFVAFVDADVVPHPEWLAELLESLRDPSVGVATGLQWFEPTATDRSLGSWTRALWNAAAIVPSACAANIWAGSMACRYNDLKRGNIGELWKQSIVDDGPLKSAFARMGMRVRVCPQLIMINRESCSFGFAANYMARTLMWSRWYERTFWLAVAAALLAMAIVAGWTAAVVGALIDGNLLQCAWLVAAALVGSLLSWCGYQVLRGALLRQSAAFAPRTVAVDWSQGWVGIVLVPILHLIFPWAVWRAGTAHQILWRGVRYRIDGPFRVKRLDHPPLLEREDVALQRSVE